MILEFLFTILIVGIVTAGLNIKFDRFFAIILLIFILGLTVFEAVNIFLWVIMLGALIIILENRKKISELPKNMKIKFFILVPTLTLIASFFGSYLFSISASFILLIILGILAFLYGLRLIFIHFKSHEIDLQKSNPLIAKICGFFGPLVSGFFVGFIGTSLKPLKIPFAVKIGKMNLKQVYLGNTITAFFASAFAIIWHLFLTKGMTSDIFFQQMMLGVSLWFGIHVVSAVTNLFFKDKWKKIFQIMIGIILVAVSIKIFITL